MSRAEKQPIRVAVLGAASASGERGGAESFYEGLVAGLARQVAQVEFIAHPADESSYEQILANYDYWAGRDLSAFDVVISTKAPTYAVRHPNHIVYLVHTVRAYYDMFDQIFPQPTEQQQRQRAEIHRRDSLAFGNAKRIFCIGDEVSRRLRKWNGVDAETLHPPMLADHFRPGQGADYFLVPGRLHRWKRVDLAIRAFRQAGLDCELRIAGSGEAERELRALAGDDPRIRFLGRVSDEELIELYANCAAVLFTPVMEDYGYITLEAFSSGKPVITCTDSGEPLQFVQDGITGAVADPSAESLAEAMRTLWSDRAQATRMGAAGRKRIAQINWPAVVETLLEAAAAPVTVAPSRLRATVLDMQPIDPPVGGGRLRLLGLYHHLHGLFRTDYIGSYDWPGEKYRTVSHSDTLLETTIPMSREHFEAAAALSREASNKTVIDLSFSRLGGLSTDYVRAAIDHVTRSDVVVFSHPWVFPLVARYLRPDQLIVYESHNVEGYLRAQFLDRDLEPELGILEEVVRTEYQALRAADLVLACSQEDIELFVSIYEIDPARFRLVPNGVMTSSVRPAEPNRKGELKRECALDTDGIAAIFLGSNYGPNIEAARFILETLAVELPEVQFVIAGGVSAAMPRALPANVTVTGFLSEQEKLRWLRASDIAVNPMFGGSGTNIKMFDFMAAGLATLSTPTGARGIAQLHPLPYLVAEREEFAAALRRLAGNRELLDAVAADGRRYVEQHFSWERISKRTGRMMRAACRKKGNEPYFSVIVPSYNRPEELRELLGALRKQTFTAFEVIVVDQSPEPLAVSACGLDIEYCHTDVRGAIHARNYGASLATAARLAFIDDDCLPDSRWLENARRHFEHADEELVGIEGEIVCPESDRSRFRVVTNVGGAGLYMTANLFVTASAFRLAGGFDPIFDNPHFREDTDLGWRLEELGAMLRADDVVITHPAAPKTLSADSDEVRDRFFEKDALLCRKHPEKFRELFLFEEHYRKKPGYWPNFLRGAQKYQVDLEECFYSRLPAGVLQHATTGASHPGNA